MRYFVADNEQSYQHTADWRERHCRTAKRLKRVNNIANCTAQAVDGRWCYRLAIDFLNFFSKQIYKQLKKNSKMNEQTAKLVEQLAQKLGTTTEYLWSVLLKQAPISALTDLIYFVLISIGGYFLLKVHKKFSKEDEHGDSKYYDNDALAPIMITVAVLWAILFIVAFFSIGNVVNGFLNPEYWALDETLSSLKPD